jgi:acetylglutamate kinase
MFDHTLAEFLIRATAFARARRDRVQVVKLGGSAMEDPVATRGTLETIVCLQTLGIRMVLVHGGGKAIDRAMAAAGLTPKKVAGRRYTGDATLDIVVKVLGELSGQISRTIHDLGGQAAPLHSPSNAVVLGCKLTLDGGESGPIDLGRVGQPTRVRTESVQGLLDSGYIPVLPSLALSENDGRWLNVNADTLASAVAGALQAESCLFLTDIPGILQNKTDESTLYHRLTRSDCQQLIDSGIIEGGMIPKVEACLEALDAGAKRTVICDGRNPRALMSELLGAPLGTEIVP